jgi:hypothetical protein
LAHLVEYFPSKLEVFSSISSTAKRREEEAEERKRVSRGVYSRGRGQGGRK